MFKKIEIWILYLLCIIFFFVLIGFGTILKHELTGGNRFPIIQKSALFVANIPYVLKRVFLSKKINIDLVIKNDRFSNKPRFKKFKNVKRNELLILPRYDGDAAQSIVEIIDLNNFSVLHTYKPKLENVFSDININSAIYKEASVNLNSKRYLYFHPLIEENGDMVFKHGGPLAKVNVCGKKIWVNQNEYFHHSVEKDFDGNYWTGARNFPYKIDKKLVGKKYGNFVDDAIVKVSPEGKIFFKKSVTEILIENGYKNLIFSQEVFFKDPIHLNDVVPVLKDSLYWKKDDLFLSLRNLSIVILYRPRSNEIIEIINGPLSHHHDVDIISEKEISIFNNNRVNTFNGSKILTHSEILIYNFETKKFTKKFQNEMKINKIKTSTNGLSHILEDGSVMVEETKSGRIIFFDKFGSLEWEYINRAKNKNTYLVSWARILKNESALNLKQNLISKTC